MALPWQPPSVPPASDVLRAGIAELQRGVEPAPPAHVDWCLAKLFVLPSRAATAEDQALQADNFQEVAGHYPTDLWTEATTEILRTSKFRPAPAELVALVDARFRERQRMLERARSMLEPPKPKLPPPPPVPKETGLQRLQNLRTIYANHQRQADVDRIDRLIAIEQGTAPRPMLDDEPDLEREPANDGPFVPSDTPMNRRLRELAEASRGRRG